MVVNGTDSGHKTLKRGALGGLRIRSTSAVGCKAAAVHGDCGLQDDSNMNKLSWMEA